MVRSDVAGLDGSPESRTAAEWAAREAKVRGLPLKVVHVWEPVPEPMAEAPVLGGETQQHWSERIPRETARGLEERHPGIEVIAEQRTGQAAEALTAAAADAELLVLGSRGLGGLAGFLVGSVGRSVIAHTETPVVVGAPYDYGVEGAKHALLAGDPGYEQAMEAALKRRPRQPAAPAAH